MAAMAKIADGNAITYKITVHGEVCEVTVLQTSKTVFVAYGTYKERTIEAKGGTSGGARNRWRELADRSDD